MLEAVPHALVISFMMIISLAIQKLTCSAECLFSVKSNMKEIYFWSINVLQVLREFHLSLLEYLRMSLQLCLGYFFIFLSILFSTWLDMHVCYSWELII